MELVAKSSYKCTGIFGSNAAGEAVPPHFQQPTAATAVEHEKVQLDYFVHIKKPRGQFGCDKVEEWPCGFGTNKKSGMNDVEYPQPRQAPKELPESSQGAYSSRANYSSLELLVNVFC
jgi:hypothetical protein